MIKVLNKRNFDLTRTLIYLKEALEIHRILGLNAEEINRNEIGLAFFIHLQRIEVEIMVINICKLFEVDKKYPLNSIPGILKYLKSGRSFLKEKDACVEFILKHGGCLGTRNVVFDLENVVNDFCKKHGNIEFVENTFKEMFKRRIQLG